MQRNIKLKFTEKIFFESDIKLVDGLYTAISKNKVDANFQTFGIQQKAENNNVIFVKYGTSVIVTFFSIEPVMFLIGNNFKIEDLKNSIHSSKLGELIKDIEFYSQMIGDVSDEEIFRIFREKKDSKKLISAELRSMINLN